MLRHLKLISLFARLSIQNDAAYRLDFLLRIVFAIIHQAAELMGVWIIFHNTRELNGWTVWHCLTLLGVFRVIAGSIRIFVAPNMRQTMDDIRTGALDYVLLRPVDSQFLASLRRIVLIESFDIVLGLGLAAIGVWKLSGTLPLERLAAFVLMLALAVTIVYSIWLTLGTLSFWFTRIANIEMVFWNVFEFARYPVAIYPPKLQWLLTYVIAVAFITTVPAEAAFGRLPIGTLVAGCLLAPAMLVAASAFWRYGLRHYSGASA